MFIPRLFSAVALLAALACTSTRTSPAARPLEVARAAEVIEPYDLKYIDSMTHHQQQGVALAQVAWRRAAHDELKGFARDLAARHRSQVEIMGELREEWFAGTASARDDELPGMNGSGDMGVLSRLEQASDEDFDLMFVTSMIEHHENGIAMANDALENATREELKAIAQSTVAQLQEENQQMRRWVNFWLE